MKFEKHGAGHDSMPQYGKEEAKPTTPANVLAAPSQA